MFSGSPGTFGATTPTYGSAASGCCIVAVERFADPSLEPLDIGARTLLPIDDAALAVENHQRGQSVDVEPRVESLRVNHRNRPLVASSEVHHAAAVVIDVDRQEDGGGLTAKILDHPLEQVTLHDARTAPRGPEVHHDNLAVKVRQANFAAVRPGQHGGKRVAQFRVRASADVETGAELVHQVVVARQDQVAEALFRPVLGDVGAAQLAAQVIEVLRVSVGFTQGEGRGVLVERAAGPARLRLDVAKPLGDSGGGIGGETLLVVRQSLVALLQFGAQTGAERVGRGRRHYPGLKTLLFGDAGRPAFIDCLGSALYQVARVAQRLVTGGIVALPVEQVDNGRQQVDRVGVIRLAVQ